MATPENRFRPLRSSVTSKKSPNVYKSCSKKISLEKLKILIPLQILPKNVGDLGKLIVATGFEKLPKVQKIAQSCLTVKKSQPSDSFYLSAKLFYTSNPNPPSRLRALPGLSLSPIWLENILIVAFGYAKIGWCILSSEF